MNVEKILEGMSLEQKVAQLMLVSYISVSKEEAKDWAKKGAGAFLHVFGEDALELQKIAVENGNPPLLLGIDAVHGHALNKNATVFPTQLSMACSWNKDLIKKVGECTAKEVVADSLNWVFSPVLCLGRDLRWGRLGETFGEDKYLSAQLGASIISGYQGDNLKDSTSVLACAKHFIGYGEATGGRDSYDTEITYRKILDLFLDPFELAVKVGCKSVMTAYGSIDGTPCTIDRKLLTEILRFKLGYDGFVVTDWQNVNNLVDIQFCAKDISCASKLALEAGNDMIMNTNEFYETVISLVKSGEIEESIIDRAVERILKVKEELGLFNGYKTLDKSVIGCFNHLKVNEEIAKESVVLLKNDKILPLSKQKKILVVGDSANDIRANYGDWTYFTHPNVDYYQQAQRPYVTLYEGLKEEYSCVDYVKGYDLVEDRVEDLDCLERKATDYDVIVFACGDNVFMSAEGKDLANLELPNSQKEVFEALLGLNKPIISVLISSKPFCVKKFVENSRAFLTSFNSGMFGGRAMAEVISGKVCPSGKLPISFANCVGELPVYYNQLPGRHCDHYVNSPKTPLFSFGEGLSYNKYIYSNVNFDASTLKLSFEIKNIGEYDSKEVVQVYIRDLVSSVITPIKQLVYFEKLPIKSGETKKVTFTIDKKTLSFVDKDCNRVIENGEFEIMVGSSSKDEDLHKIRFSI